MPPSAHRLHLDSLFVRLIASAALWSAVALLAAGLILTSLYQRTVENAFDDRLRVYLTTLVGALAKERPEPTSDPGNLGEQRFEQLYSGWYWQVRRSNANGPVILASGSLFNEEIDVSKSPAKRDAEGLLRTETTGPDGQFLRVLDLAASFPAPDGADQPAHYSILVAGNAGEMANDIAAFRNSVALTLAVFGFGLIAATTVQIRWGLRPLDQVRRGLADLRSGKEARFEGPFPAEVAPLAVELNALIKSNKEIIERARTHVGNLAHALKTPLSVITNEARSSGGPLGAKIGEQAEMMRSQISHYLDRARIAAQVEVIGAVTPVEPPLARLVRAMNKIYGAKGIAVTAEIPANAQFRGEQQDLEEIAGNLLDNACKWAKGKVLLRVAYQAPASEATPGQLTVTVEDDGPGLTEAQAAEATRRGRRLDESKPGSGLGLSIVTDLVGLYGGSFSLGRSGEGGLAAAVVLPAA